MKRLFALLLLLPGIALAQPQTTLQVGTGSGPSGTTIQFGTSGYVLGVGANGRLANVPATFPASSIAVGTTGVTGGSNGILYDNGGTLGALAQPLPVANGGTGISSFGAGIATWLGTPSSANLRAAVTDESGTGSLLFQNGNIGTATGTSLALGGATPGSNDLAVNGTAFFDSNVTIDAAILFGTVNTAILSSSGLTGQFLFRNGAGSTGGIIDVSTDATFRLRNRANSANADLELGSINAVTNIYASGSLVNSSTANNASIRPESTGTIINRNIADANPALTVRQQHASSTGNLIDGINSSGTAFAVSRTGSITTGSIGSAVTGVTQSPGTNNTTLATTAYADAAVSAGGVPVASTLPYAGISAPSGYLFANGQAVSRSTYSALFAALTASSTVTITIASPGVVTWNSHGLSAGAPIVFSSTGALPTGLTVGTTYYVRDEAANTFQVSATPGGAAINTTGSQSGVQTARYIPFGNGDGSTTFNVPDLRGRAAFGVDNMGGVSFASRIGSNTSVGGVSGLATLGIAGGAQTHVQTIAELAPHTHASAGGMVAGSDVGGTGAYLSAGLPNNGTSGSTGSGSAFNITPPLQMLNYIIKHRRRPGRDRHRPQIVRRRIRRAA